MEIQPKGRTVVSHRFFEIKLENSVGCEDASSFDDCHLTFLLPRQINRNEFLEKCETIRHLNISATSLGCEFNSNLDVSYAQLIYDTKQTIF